jgi:hypothetical protein
MKVRFSVSSKIFALALVAVVMAVLAGGALHASNMGFKMNKVLHPKGVQPQGDNLVSLPFRHPYTDMDKLCDAFGLNNTTTVEQLQGGAPCGGLVPYVHFCDGADVQPLTPRRGVLIVRPYSGGAVAISGILVGSHAGGPPGADFCSGAGNDGLNRFPVLYHGTAATAGDICTQAGLDSLPGDPTPAHVERVEAGAGVVVAYECGDAAPFSLVLGEAVIVTNQSSNVIGFVPPHF